MRTTLDIADDVLHAAKERARREHRSAGAVISDLARQALLHVGSGPVGASTSLVAEATSFYGFEPLPSRGAAVSNELIDRLRELEDGE
jgi:hypothetical protein